MANSLKSLLAIDLAGSADDPLASRARSVLAGRIVSLLGSSKDEARAVLIALGWKSVEVTNAQPVYRKTREKPVRADKPKKPEPPPNPNSPFARLAALKVK